MRSRNDAPEAAQRLKRVFLSAGEIACPLAPALVTTVLGSCVSLCLWDPLRRLGAINHYVLPHGTSSARYGQAANDLLLQAMLDRGSTPGTLRAKVFGGARAPGGVGPENVAAALAALRRHGIPLAAQRTGGIHGMLLHFRTDTGAVMLRAIGGGTPEPRRAPRR